MPVTFGSVGDIISVCLLIKDLVTALDKSCGSSAEYLEVIRELWALDRVLLEVEILTRTLDDAVELNALHGTARRAADQCRQCIEAFLEKIKKYQNSLKSGGSGNAVKDIARKLQWQAVQKDVLARFRAEINAHCSSIGMLLVTANM